MSLELVGETVLNNDEKIRTLKVKKDALNRETLSLKKERDDYIRNYNDLLKSKDEFEAMIEETLAYLEKKLFFYDDNVKILKRSFTNVKNVLNGSDMQSTYNDYVNAIQRVREKIAWYDDKIDALCYEIRIVQEEIERLTAEVNILNEQ